ncbi:FAD binding domain-containing protein [Aspergillus carlsbadensis]|nr:FAD binding domain-containing protein [Aspergillus carlsbadensis]
MKYATGTRPDRLRDFTLYKLPTRTTSDSPSDDTFVLIVGAGPIGLFASIALANHGYRSVILERKPQRSMQQPKAHAINAPAIEILAQAGLSIPALRKLGARTADAEVLRFEQSPAGIEYGQFPYERQDDAVKEFVPEPLVNVPQPNLEEFLQDQAVKTGLVTIHYGWQWYSCSQVSASRVCSKAINIANKAEGVHINSKYLLACDGAQSRARAAFGIPIRTPESINPTSARYISATVSADWTRYRSGMLHVIIQDDELRVFVAYDRASSWVLMFGIPDTDPVEKYTEAHCREVLDKAVGEKVDYKIANICAWETASQISNNYRSEQLPSAFLLGDAAHTFPNAGGLGVNTGIGDVQNLVWKLHAIEKGWTQQPDGLLNTYTAERRPVAEVSSKISDHNQTRVRLICRQDTINAQWSFSDHLNLHLGYVYGEENLGFKPQGGEHIPANSLFYRPQCITGARLPHGWVSCDGETISTIGMVAYDAFTVGREFVDEMGTWSAIMGFPSGRQLVVVRPDHHILGFAETTDDVGQLILKNL